MNSYSVLTANYDGSSSNQNPPVWIHGSVDGISAGWFATTWYAIKQAYAIGGSPAVRLLLGPLLWGCVYGPPMPPVPPYFSPNVTPPPAANANNTNVSVPEALVGTWSA